MTTEKAPDRSLHGKLAQVMYEVGRIPKNGTAPQAMGGFKFVQVGDAADVIRKALAEHKVSMIPTAIELIGESEHPTSSGKMMTTMTVRTTWTLTDGDSGETAVIQSMGSGADMGDKAAPKAQSNAMKYALLMGFLLSTGDDPEMTDSSDRQSRPAPTTVNGGPPIPGPAPLIPPDVETETLVGDLSRTGTAKRRDAKEPLTATQGPNGHNIVFRLEMPRKAGEDEVPAIPQVVVKDGAGEALYLSLLTKPDDLVGQHISVKGRLFNVTRPGKRSFYRLHVSEWATTDYQYPASDEPPLEEPPDDVDLVGARPLGLVG